jgi:hypothetical protein
MENKCFQRLVIILTVIILTKLAMHPPAEAAGVHGLSL